MTIETELPAVKVKALTLSVLQRAHIERQEEWCPDQKPDLSFRGNELGGECGEAQNVIKKLERERHGWRGSRDTVEHLGEEIADVIHCAVLVAITAGIDIESAVIAKFNSTSEKNGLSTFLPLTLKDDPGNGDQYRRIAKTRAAALEEAAKHIESMFDDDGFPISDGRRIANGVRSLIPKEG